MAKKSGKRLKLLKGEKLMYILLLILMIAIPMFNVFTSSMLSETNTKVERLKNKIAKQEEENQSLEMQIDELASLDNIKVIAKQYGLSYINSNIKSINKE